MPKLIELNYAGEPAGGRMMSIAAGLGIAGCAVGILALCEPFGKLWSTYRIPPPGTSVRAIGLYKDMAICAAVGLLIALPLSCVCLWMGWKNRRIRWLGWVAILLSVVAVVGEYAFFQWVVVARHLKLV